MDANGELRTGELAWIRSHSLESGLLVEADDDEVACGGGGEEGGKGEEAVEEEGMGIDCETGGEEDIS